MSLEYRGESSNPVWNGRWTAGVEEGLLKEQNLKGSGEMNLAVPRSRVE